MDVDETQKRGGPCIPNSPSVTVVAGAAPSLYRPHSCLQLSAALATDSGTQHCSSAFSSSISQELMSKAPVSDCWAPCGAWVFLSVTGGQNHVVGSPPAREGGTVVRGQGDDTCSVKEGLSRKGCQVEEGVGWSAQVSILCVNSSSEHRPWFFS